MTLTGVDHKQLVEAHLGGDEEAFAAIVRAYYEGLFAHAMRRMGDAHAAEDAVQETLSRAYRALPRFNGEYQLRAWLHRILTNVCHDEGRRRQRESLTVERAAAAYTEVPPVDHDLALLDIPRREVLDALAALPASYRDALVLRYVDELSFHELARATGISEGNARLRVHRGRAALRRALAPFAGVLVFLLPFLRRGQRAALAAQLSADTHAHAIMASAPAATRVAESSLTIVDKAPSIPTMLGMAASLVVPAALPVVSDQIAAKVTPPPAAVAAPFDAAPRAVRRAPAPDPIPKSEDVPLEPILTPAPAPAPASISPPPITTTTTTAVPTVQATTAKPNPAPLGSTTTLVPGTTRPSKGTTVAGDPRGTASPAARDDAGTNPLTGQVTPVTAFPAGAATTTTAPPAGDPTVTPPREVLDPAEGTGGDEAPATTTVTPATGSGTGVGTATTTVTVVPPRTPTTVDSRPGAPSTTVPPRPLSPGTVMVAWAKSGVTTGARQPPDWLPGDPSVDDGGSIAG